jgi:hypothetical protein
MLEEAALRSKGIYSGFYHPMSAPDILYVGYGLPFKVSYSGSQPLYTLLSSSSQYSQLSIESEIRSFHRTNLHRYSLSTSFFFTSDAPLLRICQLSVQHILLSQTSYCNLQCYRIKEQEGSNGQLEATDF